MGLSLERGDDGFRVPHLLFRGREGSVDDRHLCGMDGELAGEAFAARRLGLALQPLLVLEIGEYPVDGLDSGGHGAGKAEGPGEPIREGKLAALVIFGGGAKRRGQILSAPAHRDQR